MPIQPKETIQRLLNGFSTRFLGQAQDLLNKPIYTYAIYDGSALKIGKCTCHPRVRLKQLQTANPNRLVLVAYTRTVSEKEAHRKFRKDRLRGEWFTVSKEVKEELGRWDWLDEGAMKKL